MLDLLDAYNYFQVNGQRVPSIALLLPGQRFCFVYMLVCIIAVLRNWGTGDWGVGITWR